MAEFLNWKTQKGKVIPTPPSNGTDGFAAMGKPIPFYRQQAGYEHARQMGCTTESAHTVVSAMSEQLRRDQPYEAMEAGMKHLDLIGTYRLMAALLTAEEPSPRHSAEKG